MKKIYYIALAAVFFCSRLDAQVNPKPFVIPSIQKWEGKEGFLPRGRTYTIVVEKADANALGAAKLLENDLSEIGVESHINIGKNMSNKGNVIVLKTNIAQASELGKEGYSLDVDKNIVIVAAYYKGLFWGTRTLLQLLEKATKENTGLPKGIVVDFPQYPSRGFVLDDGRKFFSLEFLKRYVKMLSYYKISEFQIHLNDNGFRKYFNNNWDSTYAGFAIESKTYPKLNKNGQFYTQKEFVELQKMAQQYGVDIIPEIDVPAHALAITQAVPEIASKKYGADHLDLSNPKTVEVVDNIFREYLQGENPVFIGPNVHIGTDEYAKEESERFRAFTDHMIRYVQGYGKHARAWGALTHAKGNTPVTSKDVTLNIWYNGYADPIAMKNDGYKLLSTPDGFLYIVPAAGYYYDYLNLPFLYQKWTPRNIGDVTFQKGDTSLMGGSFAVWNDIVGNGITAMDVHDRVFPALQVVAEKMWSGVTDTNDYKGFAKNAQLIGDGLGTRNSMRYAFPANADSVVLMIRIDSKKREQATELEHVGFNYKVQFNINVGTVNANTPLFSDPAWNTYVYLLPNRKIAFYRENYKDTFDYSLPLNQETQLSFIGSNKDVQLLVNGNVVSHLSGIKIPKGQKDTMFYVQTLDFPFKKIGDKKYPLNGTISNLKVVVFRNSKSE